MSYENLKINKGYVGHVLKSFEFEECKGCRQLPAICGMVTTGNHKICPCIKCLVKAACIIHCKEYQQIFNTAIGCSPNLHVGLSYKVTEI